MFCILATMAHHATPARGQHTPDMMETYREQAGLVRVPLPTPTLPPATTTNHYVVGETRAVLVDPAAPARSSQDVLAALVAAAAEHGTQVAALFLTHHHNDHVGAAMALRQRLRLPIWAHAATRALLPGITVDRELDDDAPVAENADGTEWRTLHTPGHAPGHLALWHAASGTIVAGDMVAGEGTILIDPRDGNMGQYLASLRRMAALAPRALAPAHGPLLTEAVAVLDHYQRHRLAREAKVREALPTTWTAPDELLPLAYADVSRLVWPLALRSVLAHLQHLAELGVAEVAGGRWRRIS